MVTYHIQHDVSAYPGGSRVTDVYCLSTDEKPDGTYDNQLLLELDTNKIYYWYDGQWNVVGGDA